MYLIFQIIIFFDNFIKYVCNFLLNLVYNVSEIVNLKQILENLCDIATIREFKRFLSDFK